MTHPAPHIPILLDEIMQALAPQTDGRYVDLTLGAGGHSEAFLNLSAPAGELLAFDVDPQALEISHARLAPFGPRAHIIEASYVTLTDQLAALNWDGIDGALVDLGASSMQFDTAARGFAFMHEGPLDMRFSPRATLTAADIVNTWNETEIADVLYQYGEERKSRKIAAAILAARPLSTTRQLADVVEAAVRKGARRKPSRIHPATQTFQALRIVVNGELSALEALLPQVIDALKPGARFAVLSFHSLEDRIVKHYFRELATSFTPSPDQPHLQPKAARLKLINRKPITAGDAEIATNPRSRSAKLRIVEKL